MYYFLNSQVKESKWLVKCFLNYLRYEKSEMNILFDVLSIFLLRSRIDYDFLREFYIIEVSSPEFLVTSLSIFLIFIFCSSSRITGSFHQVAEEYPSNLKRALVLHFLNLFYSKKLGNDHLVQAMQMLILPMLTYAFQNGQTWEVIDPNIVKTIVEKLLDPPEEVRFFSLLNN